MHVIQKERLESLGYASINLIFMIIPIIIMVSQWTASRTDWLQVLLLAAFIITYLIPWLLFDVGVDELNWSVCGVCIFLLALQIIIWYLAPVGKIFFLAYVTSFVLLLPRIMGIIWMGLLLVVGIVQTLLSPHNGSFELALISMIVMIGAEVTFLTIQARIFNDREKEIKEAKQHELDKERQRLKLASDLHDVLGQQLTAISVKAELLGRLITENRYSLATSEAADISSLSRSALSDMRKVVADTKETSLDDEIAAATNLLRAARITALLDWDESVELDKLITKYGPYMVREGVANVVHHSSKSTWVKITVNQDRLTISNPLPTKMRDKKTRVGSGLIGLRDRIGDAGQVRWGIKEKIWQLSLSKVKQ